MVSPRLSTCGILCPRCPSSTLLNSSARSRSACLLSLVCWASSSVTSTTDLGGSLLLLGMSSLLGFSHTGNSGYESEFTRIHSFMLHFEPGPCILSFTLEFNSDKQRSFYRNLSFRILIVLDKLNDSRFFHAYSMYNISKSTFR